MRTFKQFNDSNGDVCPICKTAKQEPLVLIPIPGTEDGHLAEAQQYHVTCVQYLLTYLTQTMFTSL